MDEKRTIPGITTTLRFTAPVRYRAEGWHATGADAGEWVPVSEWVVTPDCTVTIPAHLAITRLRLVAQSGWGTELYSETVSVSPA